MGVIVQTKFFLKKIKHV